MQRKQSYYKDLANRYLSRNITDAEVRELLDFISVYPEQAALLLPPDQLAAFDEKIRDNATLPGDTSSRMLSRLLQEIYEKDRSDPVKATEKISYPVRRIFIKIAAAASVLFLIGFSVYLFLLNKKDDTPTAQSNPTVDIKPPSNNTATITLGNGKTIYLDSNTDGSLSKQDNVEIIKLADGKIAYKGEGGDRSGETQYNTLFNPRGSKVINITLVDGSQVWLNAGSSLRFPVAFKGSERKVEITGEAYFDVFHDAGKPFYVSKGDMTIRVLGTSFNVNTYDDESDIKVTLLKGSVKVSRGRQAEKTLKPGQQVRIARGGDSADAMLTLLDDIDLETVTAWKRGLFSFTDADLQTVMRQLSRWYNVEVTYEGVLPKREFNGEIGKTLTLDQVLKVLTKTRVKYRIEKGNNIIIMP